MAKGRPASTSEVGRARALKRGGILMEPVGRVLWSVAMLGVVGAGPQRLSECHCLVQEGRRYE